jgi:hypothetical protein
MKDQIQNKLAQYEIPPPEKAWNEIADALDSGVGGQFANRLSGYEEEPAETSWQKIQFALDAANNHPATVVPFFKKYARPLKYATAVAAIAIVFLLVTILPGKKTESETQPNELVQAPAKTISQQPVSTPQSNDEQKQDVSAMHSTSARNISHPFFPFRRRADELNAESSYPSIAMLDKVTPDESFSNHDISYSVPVDRYIIYSDGDGNAVRLPKKLFDAFACASDDIPCKQKIKRLQEQAAASATKTDFTGLLDMLKKLEENQ